MIDIRFTVPVVPMGKGRPRMSVIAGHARVFTPAATRRWESDFAAISACHAPKSVIDEPVFVDIVAVMPRAKKFSGRKYADGFLWAAGRPDGDNIRKAVLDAMKAWWTDDARIVGGSTFKVVHERVGTPRVIVRVQSAPFVPEQVPAIVELVRGAA